MKKVYHKSSKRAVEEIQKVVSRYHEISTEAILDFADFPLSCETYSGLDSAGYVQPTEIQKEAIVVALCGNDVLGSAKTGSGKTLAFLVPVLECLWRNRWSHLDGIGALIISPTRELALQTYECLCKIGKRHDFSAGLLIGGTDIEKEKRRRCSSNIVICTPGRLLQHMDENPCFTCDNLQVLVLDEADRLLDMGFERQLNAIVENLPQDRQTLMFSATQTRSVKDLARLSLSDPVYVSVHEYSKFSTPEQLHQSYIICEEHQKLSLLWSFIKSHLHKKILVFVATCKQVRFIYEAFRRLRPGTTVAALHGSMNQNKRLSAYEQFLEKESGVLFATDIAARGLDFPEIDWVLQLDCPTDAQEYIHRVGRTARYNKSGEALLVLTPSQDTAMIGQLNEKKIPISKIEVNSKKMLEIRNKVESLCAQNPELKVFAQKAFVAYLRSVYMMQNKRVFDISTIHTDELSRSLGLVVSPRVRFLRKNTTHPTDRCSIVPTKTENGELSDAFEVEEGQDSFLNIKRVDVFNLTGTDLSSSAISTMTVPKRNAKKRRKKGGHSMSPPPASEEGSEDEQKAGTSCGIDIEEARARLVRADETDKQTFQQRVKAKHKEQKRKRKAQEAKFRGRAPADEEVGVVLGSGEYSDSDHSNSGSADFADSDREENSSANVKVPSTKRRRCLS